ncbi:PfkB family carbohydrate kinase [Brucepastera parasyntrophica]|uniref:carbohydrate kinase family protein n=1 Tax=Brucepastera parasyntrophica TaxID=2880008 RepID=UPI00210ACB64|nr:PfkB family carbohydrate kinase [Brucepastera parasyntrophica]ULQ59282.1 PfkB family carbohydrate kinase [Brucepastera parasyntrophica]
MDILGIGSLLLDGFLFLEDGQECAAELSFGKTEHVSPGEMDILLQKLPEPVYTAGGTVANALKAASLLGAETVLTGCLGGNGADFDEWGRRFESDIGSYGIHFIPEKREDPTGRCLVIYAPGKEKTIICAPSAAPRLSPGQIRPEQVSAAGIVLIDGFVLQNRPLADRISGLCRQYKTVLAIDMAAVFIAEQYAQEILRLIRENRCIIFMNEAESTAFAKAVSETRKAGNNSFFPEKDIPDTVFRELGRTGENFPLIISKKGEKGARAWQSGSSCQAGTDPEKAPLDDTGAGDVFCGTFLSAFLRGMNPAEMLALSNRAARSVLTVPGSSLDRDFFSNLKNSLDGKNP